MKKLIEIPNEINYVEVYFTLRCNLGCSYCINKNSGVVRKRKEMGAEVFANSINKLVFNNLPLTIGGGEPTLREDFYDFVNGLDKNIKIDLLTNLSFDVDEFIRNIEVSRFYSHQMNKPSYKSIRVSYHPDFMDVETVIRKAKKLQEKGYSIGFFGINHPLNMQSNIDMSEFCHKNQIYFFIKDFLGTYENHLFGYFHDVDGLKGGEKKCKCATKELLVGPGGNIFKCHRDLYHEEFAIGNIKDKDLSIEYKMRDCSKFGQCNPCDLKIKVNRFLQMGQQSTEILA